MGLGSYLVRPGPKRWEPSKQDLVKIEKLYGLGLDKESIAFRVGVRPATLFERQKEMPEIMEAFKRGRATNYERYTKALDHLALDKGNLGAIIFGLKCKFDWDDKGAAKITQNITNNQVQLGSVNIQETLNKLALVDPFKMWNTVKIEKGETKNG